MNKREVKALLKKIKRKRNDLITTANKYGLSSMETIRMSDELDQLITEYIKVKMNQEKKE